MSRILTLDQQGNPHRWVSAELAITYHAKNLVAWQLGQGEGDVLYRGGENRISGLQSQITTAPIIAIKGESAAGKRTNRITPLSNLALFRRDRHMCAYCGKVFGEHRLSRDHIQPTSRGGHDVWANVVTACEACNHKKDNQLLSECGMQLLYVPYAPNRAEALILEQRHILGCQMSYLQNFLPKHSRALIDLQEVVH